MLETVLTVFAVGTLWFWLLLIGSSIAIIAFLENERAWAATVTMVLTIAAIIGLGNMGLLGWILENPWTLLLVVLGYFLCGTIYGVVKWWLFVTNTKERYIEERDRFVEKWRDRADKFKTDPNHRNLGTDEREKFKDAAFLNDVLQSVADNKPVGKLAAEWRQYVRNFDENCKYGYSTPDYARRITMPQVRNHKGRIIAWMSYWPWSLFWTLLNDPIRRLFRRIYYQIKNVLQSISDRVYKDINDELAEPVEQPPLHEDK